MSKIALSGNASGTGTLTIAAPNTNSDYTLTLPTSSGTVLLDGASQSPTFNAVTATTLSVAGNNISAVNSMGFRNRIINGSMDIWQRGTSTTTTGNTYLADRWVSAFPTGGTVSQETSSIPTGSRYAWKFVASASNAFMQMGQQIEYMNCLDLQNITVSISFMARSVNSNAGSTGLTVRTRTIAGIDGTCLFTGTASDTSVTLTTTWTRYTVTRTLPATFGSLSLEFVLGANVSGDGIMLSQVQIEAGSVATPFERVDIGRELVMCQRYCMAYKTDSSTNYAFFSLGQAMSSTETRQVFNFKQPMRTLPTVTTTAANTFSWDTAGAGITCTLLSLDRVTTDGGTLNSSVASSSVANNAAIRMIQNATSTCSVIFSAEF